MDANSRHSPSASAAARFAVAMFTDIEGSTAYYTLKGDEAGRRKVQLHDDLLHPLAAEWGGEVIAHTGDGMLAIFEQGPDACRAAIEMQHAIAVANQAIADRIDQLHVRIAMHAGVGIREEHTMYGNVINVASRIEQLADGDQIIISDAVYATLDSALAGRCAFFEERGLRGTDTVHRLYELLWRPEALLAAREGPATSPAPSAPATTEPAIVHLDLEDAEQLAGRFAESISSIVSRYDALVGTVAAEFEGRVLEAGPGSSFLQFPSAEAACRAAVALLRRIETEPWEEDWPGIGTLATRAAIHVGDGDASPAALERVARLNSAGHGGQILLTAAAYDQVAGSLPDSLEIRSWGARLLQDHEHVETLFELVPTDRTGELPPLRTPSHLDPGRRIRFEPNAPAVEPAVLLEQLRADNGQAVVSPDDLAALVRREPGSLDEYRLARLVQWSQPRFQIDARFVELTMLVDQGEDSDGERWATDTRPIESVGKLLREVPDPALVVLGSPGAGKSTVLRRLELEAALRGIQGGDESAPVTLYLPLNQYRSGDDPAGWAADMWEKRAGGLGSLSELVHAGRVLFLLDGLNEMNAAGQSGYRSSVRAWKDFVHGTTSGAWGNRFVFSCRSLDYSTPLSSPSLRVPQVRLEPLSNRQVRQYLKLYSPRRWADIWEHIGGTEHIDMFRSPFFLKLLVDQVEAEGAIPTGRAGLFTGFVRQAVKRELERDNPLFDDEELLTDRDRRSVIAWRWASPVELPSRGTLMPALERLAYRMQATVEGGDGWLVQTAYDRALELIDHPAADDVISAAEALGVLDERELTDEVTFTHQLIQEYFAARHLTAQPEMERLVPPSAIPVEEELTALGPADPLPPLPGTGWEETVLMAAPMSPDPGRFVEELAGANLVLAGRCAALPELADRLEPKIRNDLADRLWTESRRPDIDLRRRIAAGMTLGHLGGPRFERCTGPYGEYLLPPMVEVPGGEYVIGSDEPYEYRGVLYYEEVPAGPVKLQPFALGKFAVTNREWAGFIAGDGYEDERFWPGDEAKAWRSGRDTVVNVRRMARFWRDRFQADPELVEEEYRSDRMERPMYELWLRRMNMTDEEFEAHLREYYPEGRRTEPRHWRDPRFNNPMQPVIGISWFEARAYTLWLAVQSDLPFRLPTEAEWEAAAAGRERRRFAYGNEFDALRGNTTETHVRGPTPIGVFGDGDTPEGIADLCGNTYDLTSSLWGDDPIQTSWPYPYDPDDGRENESAPITVSRVGMGGAWYLGEVHARTTYRGRDRYDLRPDEWLNFRGCRVAVSV